ALSLPHDRFNIVMMHGEITRGEGKGADFVCLSLLQNKSIDYLALGHIHNPPQSAALGTRGKYRYAGCLEGRGFDETGEKGAWLLEIRDKKLVVETFLRFAERTVYEITVDLSGVKDILEARDLALKTASVARDKDVVKLRLKGRVGLEIRRDIPRLATLFENSFFHCKIEDETAAEWNLAAFEKDASLRGEFVRQLSASLLPEDIKSDALAFGLAALAGEDIEI
ncbi:MAG: DNA repair exonuclease, partial [Clostridia bacterium]|nr:DNA repair exonuclease [Clostridia bacterium]